MDIHSQTELEGQLERITYFSEETGFTVARLKIQGSSEPVTVVGNLIAPTPGEILMLKGSWLNHPKFGRQFKITSHSTKVPATVDGIRKYLGSRLIKGIGPVMASRIVQKFGKETLDVIDHHIEQLAKVEGIGRKRIEMIEKAWSEQKEIREVMIFLQAHGIGTGWATKIFKRYGRDSIAVINKNPYRLATEIFGIGFLSADKIAGKIGFEKTAPVRAEAGILYVLQQFTEEGHVYYPYDLLIEKCREILEVDRDIIVNAFGTIAFEKKIVIEDLNQDLEGFLANHKAVYLQQLYASGKQLRVGRTVNMPQIDGALGYKEWTISDSATNFIQLEPDKGNDATENTVVYATYDDQFFYVVKFHVIIELYIMDLSKNVYMLF